jgi:glycosyltransferase involved in cell wall biosynthesis
MRIAHVSPLTESVPPQAYGGTERVVSWLIEAMTGMGHDVTLFAAADSVTSATLRACCPRALRSDPACKEPLAHEIVMMNSVAAEAASFDIIHFHTSLLQFPLFRARQTPTPSLSTLHGRLDLPELRQVFDEFPEMPLVSISDAQREPVPDANFVGTVRHGLPEALFEAGDGGGGYVAFLGRFSPEKAPDDAIRIALRAGLPIRLAAKIDKVDEAYFEAVVKPLLREPGVEYVGEISEPEKQAFLGEAAALLFPICWPEPFGLVMIEAMACGTPVVAYRRGSVPEIVDDGVSGFVVDGLDGAVAALSGLNRLSRSNIRRHFEQRFSATRMAKDYIALYEELIARRALLGTRHEELLHA